jgi:hypothetical protein
VKIEIDIPQGELSTHTLIIQEPIYDDRYYPTFWLPILRSPVGSNVWLGRLYDTDVAGKKRARTHDAPPNHSNHQTEHSAWTLPNHSILLHNPPSLSLSVMLTTSSLD